jgi:hypothetical protein
MKTIKCGPETWAECVGLIIVALQNGNTKGQQIAHEELVRMAKVADLGCETINAARDCVPDLERFARNKAPGVSKRIARLKRVLDKVS